MDMSEEDLAYDQNDTVYDKFFVDYLNTCSQSADRFCVPELVAMSVLVALGLIGNGLVIFVLVVLREHLKSRPGWILIQMIIANSMYLFSFLFNIGEEAIGKWTMTELGCKFQKLFVTASANGAIILLVITNAERTITYAGSYFPQQLFSKCSVASVRAATSALIWLLCFCGSIPHFQLASIDVCEQCAEIHPLSREEICDYLKLNKTECAEVAHEMPTDPIYKTIEEYWTNDFFLSNDSYDFAYDTDSHVGALETRKRNAAMAFPCCHDEPPSFFRLLYIRFVLFFAVPVISMVASAAALCRYRKQIRPIINSQRDASTGQWMMTVMSFNLLFLVSRVPFHAIDLARVRGLHAPTTTCKALLHYSRFSVVAYHAIFPFLYMCLTRNFRHQILASCATVVYSVVERASKTSDFISMRRAAYSSPRPRDGAAVASSRDLPRA